MPIDVIIAISPNLRGKMWKNVQQRVSCVIFAKKIGHYERTCRAKRGRQRGRGALGMIQEHDSNDDPAWSMIGTWTTWHPSMRASSVG